MLRRAGPPAADRRRGRAPRRRDRRAASSTASPCSTSTTCGPSPAPGSRSAAARSPRSTGSSTRRSPPTSSDALARQAAPTVAALHARAEEIRQAELDAVPRPARRARRPPARGGRGAHAGHRRPSCCTSRPVRLKDAAGTPRGERLADALAAAVRPRLASTTSARCGWPPGAARSPAGRREWVAARARRRRRAGRRRDDGRPPPGRARSTAIGGQGVFVKEVQAAVLDGRADAAVHSAKDLPSTHGRRPRARRHLRAGRPARRPRRVAPSTTCPTAARVATGSVRRRAQLAHLRPDLALRRPARQHRHPPRRRPPGSTPSSMAVAALRRLGLRRPGHRGPRPDGAWSPRSARARSPSSAGPTTTDASRRLAAVDHRADAAGPSTAERAFLATLGGGCTLPVGAYATAGGGLLWRSSPPPTAPRCLRHQRQRRRPRRARPAPSPPTSSPPAAPTLLRGTRDRLPGRRRTR